MFCFSVRYNFFGRRKNRSFSRKKVSYFSRASFFVFLQISFRTSRPQSTPNLARNLPYLHQQRRQQNTFPNGPQAQVHRAHAHHVRRGQLTVAEGPGLLRELHHQGQAHENPALRHLRRLPQHAQLWARVRALLGDGAAAPKPREV